MSHELAVSLGGTSRPKAGFPLENTAVKLESITRD